MKKSKIYNYTAVFEQDYQSGGFVVTIPALPGCISEGDSFEDAKKNIEEAAALYLETMSEAAGHSFSRHDFVIAPIQVKA